MGRLSIMLAALLWGTIAIFIKKLSQIGLTEMEIVAIRVIGAFSCLLLFILLTGGKNVQRLQPRHIWYFIGTGVGSIVFFNWAYFTTMNMLSISIAVMLLYTAPAFVAVLSYIFLKEPMTKHKVIATSGTVIGCAVLAFAGSSGGLAHWSVLGFTIGLCSGFGYALYSIFGKLASIEYNSLSITFFTFMAASIAMLPFFPFRQLTAHLSFEVLIYMVGLALVPTVFAYLLYTYGLWKVEASTASVLATIEPISAICIGIVCYHENLQMGQIAGTLFIMISIFIISHQKNTAS